MNARANRPIVLVGMMGAGKSTVGATLSRRLDVPFVDLDEVIERRDGREVGVIFDEEGESRFRQLETQSLGDILASSDSAFVLSTGGGVVTVPHNRRLLVESTCQVVFLEASIEELTRRIPNVQSRPLLRGDVRLALESLWVARADYYREVSDIAVATDGRGVDEVVEVVLGELGVRT
jgi:shikimate kinase